MYEIYIVRICVYFAFLPQACGVLTLTIDGGTTGKLTGKYFC